MKFRLLIVAWSLSLPLSAAQGQQFDPADHEAVQEHAPWGHPVGNPWKGELKCLARNGYILAYDERPNGGRVPSWVCFRVTQDFLEKRVERKGKYATFRTDPDVAHPVRTNDYVGFFESRGYARGHLAPWAVMGGDRNGDGRYADEDPEEEETIFQANRMTNIAPQHHQAFNGTGGMWYECERFIQEELVRKQGKEVFVVAGCIFGIGTHEAIGPNGDIWVPAMFYQIVAWREDGAAPGDAPQVLAFLFPHHRAKHGRIEHFLVTVDVIESLAGVDFFPDLPQDVQDELEDTSTWETWQRLHPPSRPQRRTVTPRDLLVDD